MRLFKLKSSVKRFFVAGEPQVALYAIRRMRKRAANRKEQAKSAINIALKNANPQSVIKPLKG